MAALFEALNSLSPTTFESLPLGDDLEDYLANCFRDAGVLVSSLPPSQDGVSSGLGGLEELQKEWKVIKLSAKENPLGIQAFKLQSKDGKGTWFARRSVHASVRFKRFQAGLEKEFQQGDGKGIGEERGNVRGIGREKQLERKRCKLGWIEVNYLSARFPGPSAPRDFVEACLTSSASPEDLSHPGSSSSSSSTSGSRQFTMISRPLVDHPECAERPGYVRGQYESVEFIREIPTENGPHINRRDGCASPEIKRVQSVPNLSEEKAEPEDRKARRRGKTITFADGSIPAENEDYTPRVSIESSNIPAADLEQNPVEWIMITRSDPGGSVPRWMVERGTPGSIVRDAEKFLDWVEKRGDLENDYLEMEEAEEADAGASVNVMEEGAIPGQQKHEESEREMDSTPYNWQNGDQALGEGLITSAINTLSASVAAVTPPVIYTPSTTVASSPTPSMSPIQSAYSTSGKEALDDKSDSESLRTFTTAVSTGLCAGDISPPSSSASSIRTTPSTSTSNYPHHHHTTPEEKSLNRLLREKSKLSTKLAKQMEKEERKRSKDGKKEDWKRLKDGEKEKKKHLKEMEKREGQYRKAIEKAKRREIKRERKEGRDRREFGELKRVVEGLTRENLDLRARVDELERREEQRVDS